MFHPEYMTGLSFPVMLTFMKAGSVTHIKNEWLTDSKVTLKARNIPVTALITPFATQLTISTGLLIPVVPAVIAIIGFPVIKAIPAISPFKIGESVAAAFAEIGKRKKHNSNNVIDIFLK